MADIRGLVTLGKPYNEKPDERDFARILVEHCDHWREIGLELGLNSKVLKSVKANHGTQQEYFGITLEKWLDLNSEGTWADLEFAITNVNRANLALDVFSWSNWRLAIIKKLNLDPQQAPRVKQSGASPTQPPPISHEQQQDRAHGTDNQPLVDKNKPEKQSMGATNGGTNGDAHSEGNKKAKSMYPVIGKNPPCAVIINNENFKKGLKKRSKSENDVTKITELENVIGSKFIIYRDHSAEGMELALKEVKDNLSKETSGLIVFIMTHGDEEDMLYGSDNELIPLKELVEMFESDKCEYLEDKPKIFIIHACRGGVVEPARYEANSEGPPAATVVKRRKEEPKEGTPRKADFLFAYSTTDGSVAYGQNEVGFIPKLVNILKLKFNDKHLEDILLDVKKEVASESYCQKGKYFKQMPSVVSQMRDRVWFAKK